MTENRSTSSLELAILAGINQATVNLHTALPGVVTAFYPTEQTADVEVGIRRIMRDLDDNEREESVPLLARAPVWLPRAGGFSISLPVTAGDQVLVLFAERDLSAWLASGDAHGPPSRRRHDFSDAIVLPGLTSAGNRLATYSTSGLQIRSDDDSQVIDLKGDGSIHITADTVRLGSTGTDVIAELADLIQTLEGAVDTRGDAFNAGTISALAAHRSAIEALET